jgi:3',5'-cyclic AMP phosphodiesterase CpdA
MTDGPILRLGIVADPQYADADPDPGLNRYFRESLGRIAAAIDVFNGRELDAVVTLGDVIDHGWESFDPVLALFRRLRHRALFLPGNHDFSVAPEHLGDVHRRLGMPAHYHDLLVAGHRLIVLDGSEISLFAPPEDHPRRAQAEERLALLKAEGARNAHRWNGGLGQAQLTWLGDVLDHARDDGEPVVILCHYPAAPENAHNLFDAQRLLALIETYPNVRAYLCGHNHAGNSATRRASGSSARSSPERTGAKPLASSAAGLESTAVTHFVTFKGMVDTPDQTAFAIVTLHPDRLEIEGFGREASRVLRF